MKYLLICAIKKNYSHVSYSFVNVILFHGKTAVDL